MGESYEVHDPKFYMYHRRLQQAHHHNVIEEQQIFMVDKINQTKEELELLKLENSLWYEKTKAVGCGIMFIGAIGCFLNRCLKALRKTEPSKPDVELLERQDTLTCRSNTISLTT